MDSSFQELCCKEQENGVGRCGVERSLGAFGQFLTFWLTTLPCLLLVPSSAPEWLVPAEARPRTGVNVHPQT